MDALLGDYRTASAQNTQTQAAIANALLAPDGPGPGRVHHQPNHFVAGGAPLSRRPGHGNGLEHCRRAAQLLHHRTVDGLLAGKLGVTEAASALQIAARFPDDGGADQVAAATGEQILGSTDVKLDGPPQQRLQRGPGHAHRGSERGRLHPDPSGEPVEHRAHLQLDARAGAALRLPLPARRGLQLRGVHVRGRQRLRPIVRQLRGRPGRLEHGQDVLHSAAKRSGEAHFGAHFQAPGLPNQTAGTVEEDTAASALLLKHEFLDGGADDVTLATLGEVLLEPTLTTLELEGYAITLSASPGTLRAGAREPC